MTPCKISNWKLACLVMPNGMTTSGKGQDFIRKLDKLIPAGRAFMEFTHNGSVRLLSQCETICINLTANEFAGVTRS